MGQKQWVRLAKCQLLVACLFIMVLAFGGCIMTAMTGLGGHFTILTKESPPESSVRAVHSAMVLYGGSVCTLLFLNVLLSSLSVLRESQQLMATAFLVSACLFCALIAGVTWTHACQDQVAASFLDVYDGLFDLAVRESSSGGHTDHLLSVHDNFQCCGKISWRQSLLETHQVCTNMSEELDCVLVISIVLNTHLQWVIILLILSLGFTVYGMILSSFLYFSFPRGTIWERRGEYSLTNASSSQTSTPDTPLTQLLPYQHAK
ncbi:tetraspanin-32 [Pelodytes ibericus]